MHIGLIGPEDYPISPLTGGSVQIYLRALSAGLAAHGNQVTLYSPPGGSAPPTRPVGGGVRCVTVPRRRRSDYVRRCGSNVQQEDFDVLQIDNRPLFVPRLRQKCTKAAVVLNMHSSNFLSPRRIPSARAARILDSVDAIVANSHFVRRRMGKRFPRSRRRIHVIYPGVDCNRFVSRFTSEGAEMRSATRKEQGLTDDDFVILFVGRIIPRKGVATLLRAVGPMARSHRHTHLWIAGRRLRSKYQRRLDRLAGRCRRIRFLDRVSPERIHKIYLAADLLVCPSIRTEAFGLVNIEAQATGLPVVASRQGGIPEAVRDRMTGLLVRRYRSPVAFRKCIRSLRQDPKIAEQMGRAGAAWVREQFDWERCGGDFTRLYSRLVGDDEDARKGCSTRRRIQRE